MSKKLPELLSGKICTIIAKIIAMYTQFDIELFRLSPIRYLCKD